MFKKSVVEALDRIRAKSADGLVKSDAVIEAARDKHSPLHRYFTWDIKSAALKCWRQEARELITSIEIWRDEAREQSMQVYVSLDSDRAGGGGYRHVDQVANDPDLRREMVATALREMKQLESRYHRIKQDLALVWNAVDKTEKKLKRKAPSRP